LQNYARGVGASPPLHAQQLEAACLLLFTDPFPPDNTNHGH
jgi:hypothetical protein